MFENVKGIRIESPFFKNGINCDLFVGQKKSMRVQASLIYGKNGTGKSTISYGIDLLSKDDQSKNNPKRISKIYFYDFQNKVISDQSRFNTHVFNESYIHNQIALRDKELGTLVIMNNDQDLMQEYRSKLENVEMNKTHLDVIQKELNNIEEQYNEVIHLDETTAIQSILENKYLNNLSIIYDLPITLGRHTITNMLKKEPISESTAKQYQLELDTLLNHFIQNLENKRVYEQIRQVATVESLDKLKQYYDMGVDQEYFTNGIPLELIELIKQDEIKAEQGIQASDSLYEAQNNEEFAYICGLYYDQPRLIDSSILIDHIPVKKQKAFQFLMTKYNGEVDQMNQMIEARMKNPFTEENINIDHFKEIAIQLKEMVDTYIHIEYDEKEYEKKKDKAIYLNEQIGIFQVHQFKEIPQTLLNRKKLLITELKNSEHNLNEAKKELDDMEERIIDIHFPLEQINQSLALILASTNRIQLVKKGKQIYIQANHNDVPVEAISTAEKNILGLVYFMVSSMQECKEEDGLIVLDDPISSTDEDHAYGIYNYLSRELKTFFKQNKSNKCILLSHNYTTFVNMSKVLTSVNKSLTETIKTVLFELLPTQELKMVNLKNQNDYTHLLKDVFDFACGNAPQLENYIGNVTRKAIEAYCNFELNIKPSELSSNFEIFDYIQDITVREYLQSSMFTMVLNNESHMDEAAKYSYEYNLIQYTSYEDLIQSAKDVLCFIYALNPLHLRRHLGKEVNIINEWIQAIQQM